jgi:hypothetical protein
VQRASVRPGRFELYRFLPSPAVLGAKLFELADRHAQRARQSLQMNGLGAPDRGVRGWEANGLMDLRR